ncbi:MAG: hypothetical protein Q9162_003098 [Coniocarpon cinnabarinum]
MPTQTHHVIGYLSDNRTPVAPFGFKPDGKPRKNRPHNTKWVTGKSKEAPCKSCGQTQPAGKLTRLVGYQADGQLEAPFGHDPKGRPFITPTVRREKDSDFRSINREKVAATKQSRKAQHPEKVQEYSRKRRSRRRHDRQSPQAESNIATTELASQRKSEMIRGRSRQTKEVEPLNNDRSRFTSAKASSSSQKCA